MRYRQSIEWICVLVLLASTPALAHEFWIEPSTFHPGVGSLVKVALRVGEPFGGEPVLRDAGQIQRFVLAGSQGVKPIAGRDGADPAGILRPQAPGLLVIGYRSHRSPVELDAEKFERYLRDEGLEKIIAERASRGENDKPGREIYSRCAKCLLRVGNNATDGYDRLLNFALEIVPQKSPYTLGQSGDMPVRIFYNGTGLEGALLVAVNRDEPGKKLTARSDRQGRVTFHLSRPGVWLIAAVHMIPAPPNRTDADWESLWASLTFEVLDTTPSIVPASQPK